MKKFAFLFFALSLSLTGFAHLANQQPTGAARAQDQPKAASEVRFPSLPVEVLPAPKPNVGATLTLALDQIYCIDSDIQILLFDSPAGMVRWTKEAGPIKVRGRFVGGVGVETRHLKGKQIYLIEAAKTGPVELIVVPVGAVDEKDALRKTLDVDAGEGPRPPPKPPGPTDTAFPMDGKFRVLILEETAERSKLTPGQQAAIFGVPVRNFLDAKCAVGPDGKTKEYRIYDKDISTASESKIWQRAVEFARKHGVPSMIISNGREEFLGDLPKDDALPLLKQWAGEK